MRGPDRYRVIGTGADGSVEVLAWGTSLEHAEFVREWVAQRAEFSDVCIECEEHVGRVVPIRLSGRSR